MRSIPGPEPYLIGIDPSITGNSGSTRCISLLVILATGLSLAAPATALGQAADPVDVGSIDAILTAVYDVISGEAGEARDWDRWHTLFAEGATLSAVVRAQDGSYRRVTMTLESYVERSGASLEQNGFVEAEINRVSEGYGMIARMLPLEHVQAYRKHDEEDDHRNETAPQVELAHGDAARVDGADRGRSEAPAAPSDP